MIYYSEAKYTEVLKNILYDFFTEEEIETMSISQICEAAAPYIFDDEIPIFDEEYRIPLEKKILLHYYTREIGAETEERFIYFLNRTLIEEMPYFNQLYKSELLEFDPLINYHQRQQKVESAGRNESEIEREDAEKDYNEFEINGEQRKDGSNSISINGEQRKDGSNSISAHDQNVKDNEISKSLSDTTNNNESINASIDNSKEDTTGSPKIQDETNGRTRSISGTLDTPQGALTGLSDALDALDGDESGTAYLTSGAASKSTSHSETERKETLDTHIKRGEQNLNTQKGKGSEAVNEAGLRSDTQSTIDKDTTIDSGFQNTIDKDTTIDSGFSNLKSSDIKSGDEDRGRNNIRAGKAKTTDAYLMNIVGLRGNTPSDLLLKFRETFLNIDKMVIECVADCFMGVY